MTTHALVAAAPSVSMSPHADTSAAHSVSNPASAIVVARSPSKQQQRRQQQDPRLAMIGTDVALNTEVIRHQSVALDDALQLQVESLNKELVTAKESLVSLSKKLQAVNLQNAGLKRQVEEARFLAVCGVQRVAAEVYCY